MIFTVVDDRNAESYYRVELIYVINEAGMSI